MRNLHGGEVVLGTTTLRARLHLTHAKGLLLLLSPLPPSLPVLPRPPRQRRLQVVIIMSINGNMLIVKRTQSLALTLNLHLSLTPTAFILIRAHAYDICHTLVFITFC